jgi:hypothetical protein
LTPDHLGFAIGERTKQIRDEDLEDRGLSGASVTTHDDETAAVIDDLIEDPAELGTLLGPSHDVVTPYRRGRSGRSNHKHYRATWF